MLPAGADTDKSKQNFYNGFFLLRLPHEIHIVHFTQ